MPQFHTRHPVPYTPQEMYAIVADVARYPEFVPLCEKLEVRTRTPKDATEVLLADMHIGYGAIREQFTTRVTLYPATPFVQVEYIDGPFQHLDNRWAFHAIEGGGTDVEFYIDYELKSMMLKMMVGGMFETVFRKFTAAFEDRARAVYGPRRVAGV